MTTITISREIGSRGDWIAEQIAKKLGFNLVNKHTIERIFLQYGFVDFDEFYDASSFWVRFDPQMGEMIGMLNQITLALAAHGNVVQVGRGGFALLKNYADVLNVRIQAPLAYRIEQVMQEEKFDEIAKAEELVKDNDNLRHGFLAAAYGNHWNNCSSFDLIIDTGKISPENSVEWLLEACKKLDDQKQAGKHLAASLDIDPVMISVIKDVLEQETLISA